MHSRRLLGRLFTCFALRLTDCNAFINNQQLGLAIPCTSSTTQRITHDVDKTPLTAARGHSLGPPRVVNLQPRYAGP
ncbi:hypothetical protein GGS23DRAFT_545658 [Durotheca rogersii]|uniref:uncharacterized protein n=1 Tax=Durotheca rogersii TaxID=419775 RepID=UPI00221EE329|nr:uncharacterized protein GGS23DRAFT_545658 [Durotheca rogersii]KAI5868459.1 hypothetical protein GGS23DRAFT_545658 [Durotheca rogersii]